MFTSMSEELLESWSLISRAITTYIGLSDIINSSLSTGSSHLRWSWRNYHWALRVILKVLFHFGLFLLSWSEYIGIHPISLLIMLILFQYWEVWILSASKESHSLTLLNMFVENTSRKLIFAPLTLLHAARTLQQHVLIQLLGIAADYFQALGAFIVYLHLMRLHFWIWKPWLLDYSGVLERASNDVILQYILISNVVLAEVFIYIEFILELFLNSFNFLTLFPVILLFDFILGLCALLETLLEGYFLE